MNSIIWHQATKIEDILESLLSSNDITTLKELKRARFQQAVNRIWNTFFYFRREKWNFQSNKTTSVWISLPIFCLCCLTALEQRSFIGEWKAWVPTQVWHLQYQKYMYLRQCYWEFERLFLSAGKLIGMEISLQITTMGEKCHVERKWKLFLFPNSQLQVAYKWGVLILSYEIYLKTFCLILFLFFKG